MCGMLNFEESNYACVPFPTPGAPNKSSRISIIFFIAN
jgi:hypothetical protein